MFKKVSPKGIVNSILMSLLVLFGCRIAKADNHNVRVLSKTADQEYKREFFTDSNLDSKDEVEKFVNKNITRDYVIKKIETDDENNWVVEINKRPYEEIAKEMGIFTEELSTIINSEDSLDDKIQSIENSGFYKKYVADKKPDVIKNLDCCLYMYTPLRRYLINNILTPVSKLLIENKESNSKAKVVSKKINKTFGTSLFNGIIMQSLGLKIDGNKGILELLAEDTNDKSKYLYAIGVVNRKNATDEEIKIKDKIKTFFYFESHKFEDDDKYSCGVNIYEFNGRTCQGVWHKHEAIDYENDGIMETLKDRDDGIWIYNSDQIEKLSKFTTYDKNGMILKDKKPQSLISIDNGAAPYTEIFKSLDENSTKKLLKFIDNKEKVKIKATYQAKNPESLFKIISCYHMEPGEEFMKNEEFLYTILTEAEGGKGRIEGVGVKWLRAAVRNLERNYSKSGKTLSIADLAKYAFETDPNSGGQYKYKNEDEDTDIEEITKLQISVLSDKKELEEIKKKIKDKKKLAELKKIVYNKDAKQEEIENAQKELNRQEQLAKNMKRIKKSITQGEKRIAELKKQKRNAGNKEYLEDTEPFYLPYKGAKEIAKKKIKNAETVADISDSEEDTECSEDEIWKNLPRLDS